MKTSVRSFAVVAGTVLVALSSLDASAAGVRVRCETRATPARARISIDGSGLIAGKKYYARAVSAGRRVDAPLAAAGANGQAGFDFDSNPNDIAAGATAIRSGFITDNQVVGRIYDAEGFLQAKDTVTCRAR
jgi:hypothetical protein